MSKGTRTEECSHCGAKARIVRGDYAWKDVDLPVTLKNVQLVKCGKCGNTEVVIPRLADMMRTLAAAVIHKPYRLRGEEVRFLRKYLDMTGADFSALLKVDKTTLSKWENNEDPVGEQSDRLIRAVAMALGDTQKNDIREAVRDFPAIRSAVRKIAIYLDPATMSYEFAARAGRRAKFSVVKKGFGGKSLQLSKSSPL